MNRGQQHGRSRICGFAITRQTFPALLSVVLLILIDVSRLVAQDARLAIPSDALLHKARRQVKALFRDEFLAALEPGEQEALSQFKAFVDHPLLRVWEYTLASFSDYKVEFFRWNLYASLGFDQKDEGGIAHLLYQDIQGKLENANLKSEALVNDYNQAVDEVNAAQTLLSQAIDKGLDLGLS